MEKGFDGKRVPMVKDSNGKGFGWKRVLMERGSDG